MSDLFWKRLNYLTGLAAIGILFGVAVLTSHLEIRDLDLWLHIGTGRFIVQNGYVPTQDVLSCAISGMPWVNHEWLFQVLVYLIHQAWGPEGLIRMQVVVVWLTLILLMFLGYNREHHLLMIFSLLLVLLVYQTRFTIRPDIFSLLFFVMYIYLLSIHIDKRWVPFALVVVQILWTNMHGFFFFGPLFVLIGWVAEKLKRHCALPYEWNKVGRLTNSEYGRLKRILVFTLLACLANPLTVRGAMYPITVLFQLPQESKIFFNYILELQRPIHWNDIFSLDRFSFYKLTILVSLYSFIFNRRHIDLSALLFWFVFLLFSLVALRNIVFFAFAAYLVIVTNAITTPFNQIVPLRFTSKRFQYLTEIFIKLFFIAWMLLFGFSRSLGSYFDYDKFENKSEMEGVGLRNFPHKAADFLVVNNVKGNIFNDFNSGAYLVGRCFPNIKVFIDGRTEVYGPLFFKNYLRIWEQGDMAFFDQVVRDVEITLAFLNSITDAVPEKILKHLYGSKEWAVVYFDYDGVIFAKRVPENEKLIQDFEIDLSQWPGRKMDLFRLGVQRVSPYPFIHRAFTLQSLGLDEPALKEVEEAFKIDPAAVESYKIMGKIYGRKGDYTKAFEAFRLVAMIDPGNKENRFNLAQTYFDLKEYKGAIQQYRAILAMEPKNIRAQFLLARSYVKNRQYDKSLEALRVAHQLAPHDTVDLLAIGNIFDQDKQHEGAREIYELAISAKQPTAEIHHQLGLLYEVLGNHQKAKENWEAALKIDPENTEIKQNLRRLQDRK